MLVQADPYRWISITGTAVAAETGPAAEAHIDALSRRYDGRPWTPVDGSGARTVPDPARPDRALRLRGAVTEVPLAARMRPRTFDEFVGQPHLIGPGRALTKLLEAGHLPSLLLWGPAGTGKTTLAYLLADAVGAELVQLSAVSSGVADARRVMERARAACSGRSSSWTRCTGGPRPSRTCSCPRSRTGRSR
ncbi:MAG: hypothetical protein KatS3mg013_0328 [Actinomycetota bacterium]|nr:MAG: hypothetical protein KatS3mg013_0328 [Actinomycetota bacterium]